jgi:hypothetical protein
MSLGGIDNFADDLLTSLKIIGMIDSHQKLCLRNGRLALSTSHAFWRWLAGDSREHTFAAIRGAVMGAIQVLDSNPPQTSWLAGRLLKELDGARAGIQKLQETYASDSLAVAQLQVLDERIQAAVKK